MSLLHQHNILIVLKAGMDSMALTLVQETLSLHLLAAGQALSPLGLFLASPDRSKARVRQFPLTLCTFPLTVIFFPPQVRRLCKLFAPMGEAMASLSTLHGLHEEMTAAGMDLTVPGFSAVLRGLAQAFSADPAHQSAPRRISLLFAAPPDNSSDGDIHGALNALLVAKTTCDFVFLSDLGAEDDAGVASERLGELALLVSSYSNCSLHRVRANQTAEDLSRLRSLWHFWRHPPAAATLRMPHHTRDIALSVRLVPLLRQAAAPPAPLTACACHNVLVARPPRCAVTGRKPTERSVMGFRFLEEGCDLQFKAEETRESGPDELVGLGTIAAASLDCCTLLGNPAHLSPLSAEGEDFVAALSVQLSVRGLGLLLKRVTRHGFSLHVALPAATAVGPLVLVQLATREDVLMAQPHLAGIERPPSHAAMAAAAAALEALPAPGMYNPLAFNNGFVAQFQRAVAAEVAAETAAPVSTASQQPQLTKKTLRLTLQ